MGEEARAESNAGSGRPARRLRRWLGWVVAASVLAAVVVAEEADLFLGTGVEPAVSSDAQGNSVVVWDDEGTVVGRRFDINGIPLSIEFSVASGAQSPDVSFLPEGEFVVTWRDSGPGSGIVGRRFDINGIPLSIEFSVTAAGRTPVVDTDDQGHIVVAWTSASNSHVPDFVPLFQHYVRRFDINGIPLSIEYKVGSKTPATAPALAVRPEGDFLVVWQDKHDNIYGQVFDAAGAPQGGPFRINQSTRDEQSAPSVAVAADGDYTVVWERKGHGHDGSSVYSRKVTAYGIPLSIEYKVNQTSTSTSDLEPVVSTDRWGNTLVAWTGDGSGSSGEVLARTVDVRGIPLSIEYLVGAADAVSNSDVAPVNGATDFMVVWESSGAAGHTAQSCIFSRKLAVSPP